MQGWEYHAIYVAPDDFQQKQNGVPLAIRALNRLGQQGWDVVTVVDMAGSKKAILLKRAVPAAGQEPRPDVLPAVAEATTPADARSDTLHTWDDDGGAGASGSRARWSVEARALTSFPW